MRSPWLAAVERGRIVVGRMASSHGERRGAFTFLVGTVTLNVVANDGDAEEWAAGGLPGPPWEHVSVSLKHRCPTWQEMTYIASLFWGPDETLIQFRPAEADYVNHHPHCLHWWKPVGVTIPVPPAQAVGPQTPRSP